jgi:type II secretory pathway component GspD/PulD (secretin)
MPPMRFEELPPPPGTVRIPLAGPELADRVQIKQAGGRLTVIVRDVPLNQVLMMLGEEQDLNIVVADNVIAPVSVALENVELTDALDALTHIAGYTWTQHNNIIHVTSAAGATRLPPHLQERRVMLFPLDYVSAADLDMTVQGLLSPGGQSFVTQRNTADNRRTQEVLVVEDTPTYLQRIAQFIEQADQQPRQVMIEAHVMAVTLKGDARHGVNFEYLFNPHGTNMRLQAQGFAAPNAPQAFFFSVDGTDLDALVECLQTQSESKTLASPKVLVLNNQEARLQVGKQLGFRVTTTTETSTLESVDFLDVGVVLRVTPRITRDGQVVMYVKPEVSSGLVNPDTGLPEEETTEVETNVLLPDGRGMVIGGLIQEKDSDSQTKVAWLGDVWVVGKLFQRKTVSRERVEIIITLLPRIVPPEIPCESPHDVELQHSMSPVVQGPLDRAYRPWEPVFRDAWFNPLTCQDLPLFCNRCGRNACRCGATVGGDSGYGYYGLGPYDGVSRQQYDGLPRPSHQSYEVVPPSGSRRQPQLLLPAGAGATATASDGRDRANDAAWSGQHGDRRPRRTASSALRRIVTPR